MVLDILSFYFTRLKLNLIKTKQAGFDKHDFDDFKKENPKGKTGFITTRNLDSCKLKPLFSVYGLIIIN